MQRLIIWIKKLFFTNLDNKQLSQVDYFSKFVNDIYHNFDEFYNQKDLIFFPEINAYGAFKYEIIKDILTNSQSIGVSDVHLALNNIYFSLKEEQHQNNKKAAIHHLDFLSKKFQYDDSVYTRILFQKLASNFPKNESFELVDYLINPIIFINVLKDFGFLEVFPEFDPESDQFSFDYALKMIKGFFEDTDTLENLIKNHLDNGGQIPSKMQVLLNDIQTDVEIKPNLPKYFKSMIFSAVESTTSFLSSLIHVIYTQYPNLIGEKDTYNKLYPIANEVLRIHTPVPFIYRTVRQDTVYSNVDLKTGDLVILFLGAANMDPSVFVEPHLIKFDRKEKNLSFGRGQYGCIGQFASFRITLNIMSYLAEYEKRITLTNPNATHFIQNSMLKISLMVKLDDQ